MEMLHGYYCGPTPTPAPTSEGWLKHVLGWSYVSTIQDHWEAIFALLGTKNTYVTSYYCHTRMLLGHSGWLDTRLWFTLIIQVVWYSLFHHLCNWEKGSLKPQFTLIHYSTTPSQCLNNSTSINWLVVNCWVHKFCNWRNRKGRVTSVTNQMHARSRGRGPWRLLQTCCWCMCANVRINIMGSESYPQNHPKASTHLPKYATEHWIDEMAPLHGMLTIIGKY
jgi:hypothetical protein